MKKYFPKTQSFALLTLFIVVSSCSAQVQPNPPQKNTIAVTTIRSGQPKLVKTQGSGLADNVHCGLQDNAGNLWFGTTGEGIYRYDGNLFTQFTTKDGLNSNTVWSVLEDRLGNVWIGTDAGLCRYDARPLGTGGAGKSISIISLTVTRGNGLQSLLPAPISPTTTNAVWSMLQDSTGKIWLGASDGVYCYDGAFFSRFLDDDSIVNQQGLRLKMVDDMLEDSNGVIWFASGMPPGMEGVCRYDGKTLTGCKPNGDSWIRYITADNKANIWFGGRSHGNFRYDGKTFTNFTEKTGIGNAVLADHSGNIWFTGDEADNSYESRDGIWRYNGSTFTNFGTKDGMGKYFVHCMIEDRDGNIWTGTRNTGLYRYDGKMFTCFSE